MGLNETERYEVVKYRLEKAEFITKITMLILI